MKEKKENKQSKESKVKTVTSTTRKTRQSKKNPKGTAFDAGATYFPPKSEQPKKQKRVVAEKDIKQSLNL